MNASLVKITYTYDCSGKTIEYMGSTLTKFADEIAYVAQFLPIQPLADAVIERDWHRDPIGCVSLPGKIRFFYAGDPEAVEEALEECAELGEITMYTRSAATYNRQNKEFQCVLSNGEIISGQTWTATVELAETRLVELRTTESAVCASVGIPSDDDIGIDVVEVDSPTTPKTKKSKRTKKGTCPCPLCTPNAEVSGIFYCRLGDEHLAFATGTLIKAARSRYEAQNALDHHRHETLRHAA